MTIKYSKLARVPGSSLLIGDIIASGETLIHCLKHVLDDYRKHQISLRNIIIFTIGGSKAIEILEQMTEEIRTYWPDFEGFIVVYYEGIFNTYQDHGVSGINVPDVDFYWKDGVIAPDYRKQVLASRDPLFEKCVIYDGGARRYSIQEHIEEVLSFWNYMLEHADTIDFHALLEEKLGHPVPVSFDDWVKITHYTHLKTEENEWLYHQEQGFVRGLQNVTLKEIAGRRITDFTNVLRKYIL